MEAPPGDTKYSTIFDPRHFQNRCAGPGKGPEAYSKAPSKEMSSLLMLDLKTDKLQDARKEEENKTFHKLIQKWTSVSTLL